MELSPSLISLTVSVDVKHYVLLLLCVLTRWDFNFCVRSSPLRFCVRSSPARESSTEIETVYISVESTWEDGGHDVIALCRAFSL